MAIAGVICAAAALAVAQEAPPTGPLKELSDMMTKAGQVSASGNKMGAIKILEAALIKTQTDPALKGRDLDVLRGMGRVYVEAQRPADAVRVLQILLAEMKDSCVVGKPLAERCADVEYDLGTAQMYANDFAGAVVTLRKSIPLYEAMIKGSPDAGYQMAKLKLQANAQSMLGAALFRSGDLPGGIAGYEKAVKEYTAVMKNPASGDGLSMMAKQSMGDAQAALKLLKDEAAKRAAEKKETPKQETPKK
jgi:tetratricopeptide (TPR) repeat protein